MVRGMTFHIVTAPTASEQRKAARQILDAMPAWTPCLMITHTPRGLRTLPYTHPGAMLYIEAGEWLTDEVWADIVAAAKAGGCTVTLATGPRWADRCAQLVEDAA
jgi:hypothetical protein